MKLIRMAAAALLALPALAPAHEVPDEPMDPLPQQLAELRRATAAFRDVEKAKGAGFAQFLDCVAQPGVGAMGVHYLHATRPGDAHVGALEPEALVYEPQADGSLKLVAIEYIVFQEAWDAANPQPPTLFGHPFHLVKAPNRYGVPAFYELHVWAWKANPLGLFGDWNPRVACPAH